GPRIAARGEVTTMPLYEFRCDKCRKKFSLQLPVSDYGRKRLTCPKCKSRRVSRIFSSFTVQTSKKS
ncbi:MAG: zinc ribbon domain-containing protein, partial [Nitrospinota bacterium]